MAILVLAIFLVGCSKKQEPESNQSTTTRVSSAPWQTQTLGGFNNVAVYKPSTYTSIGNTSKQALLIVLHGCTMPNTAFTNAGLEVAAEQYGMIVAAPEAMNKAGFSCWDYWGDSTPKSRAAGDYKNLINLAKHYTESGQVDSNQVYIAGLSSGGAFAMTAGCLAPDVFAGMSNFAGPSAGTSSSGSFTHEFTSNKVADICRNYAGSYVQFFNSQVAVFGVGTADATVPKTYAPQNAEAMASIYNAIVGAEINRNYGKEKIWSVNGRPAVSLLTVTGLGHAWPGGTDVSGSYIEASDLNLGIYLANFFSTNNRRWGFPPCDISVVWPIGTEPVSGIASISVSASNCRAIAKVEFHVDGVKLAEDLTVPYVFSWDSSSVQNGTHSFVIRVVFEDGGVQEYRIEREVQNDKICHTEAARGNAMQHYMAGRIGLSDYNAYASKYAYSIAFTLYYLNEDNGSKWVDEDAMPSGCTINKPVLNVSSPAGGAELVKNSTVNVSGTAQNAVKVIVQLKGANTGTVYTTNTITSSEIKNWNTNLSTNVTWNGAYIIVVTAENADGETETKEIPVTIQ